MSYCIRASEIVDTEILGRIHAQAWHETYADIISQEILNKVASVESRTTIRKQMFANIKPTSGHFLAENDVGEVVGFGDCGLSFQAKGFAPTEIYTLYVLRSAQGNGLGKQLLVAMFNHLTQQGFSKSALKTHSQNKQAKDFYLHMCGQDFGDVKSEDWDETVYVWPNLNLFRKTT